MIEFIKPLEDVNVTQLPTDVVFECKISKSHLPVEWYKDNQPIKHGHKYNMECDGTVHRLIIKDVDSKDIAEYMIVAKNNKSAAKLTIEAPPAFFNVDKYKDTIVLKEGTSIAIELPFNANPQPTVDWSFNKGAIPKGKRFTSDTIWNMTSLCIGRAEVKDSGTYTVTMANSVGKAVLSIKVLVLGRPSVPTDLKVTKVTENSVTLTWEPPETDGGSRITQYVIEKRDPYRHGYTQVGTTKSLDFKVGRLVEGNEYVFQVSAENDVGIGDAAELSQGITAKSPFGKHPFFRWPVYHPK